MNVLLWAKPAGESARANLLLAEANPGRELTVRGHGARAEPTGMVQEKVFFALAILWGRRGILVKGPTKSNYGQALACAQFAR